MNGGPATAEPPGSSADGPDLGFLQSAATARRAAARRRTRLALGVSLCITVVWLGYVLAFGHLDRVIDGWRASVTMLFGSFVAGSTPQGGGAVAFPVFTKVLAVPAEAARTFSLAVQTVGMGTAALAIFILRRHVAWRAVAFAFPAALIGFLASYVWLTDGEEPFRPAIIPGGYIKVSFTLVVAAMAFIVYLGARIEIREVTTDIPTINPRVTIALCTLALVGGVTAALTGSGADLFVYLALTVLLGIDPKVGVPTSVIIMAALSVVGLVLVAADGQLSVMLSDAGTEVTTIGGRRRDRCRSRDHRHATVLG